MKKNIKYLIVLLILLILIVGYLLIKPKNNINSNENTYKVITVEEFKEIASKNGYTVLDKVDYNSLNENGIIEGILDYAVGFYTDQDGALAYKVYFYEFENQKELDKYYKNVIETLKNWNDEEKTLNEEIGR